MCKLALIAISSLVLLACSGGPIAAGPETGTSQLSRTLNTTVVGSLPAVGSLGACAATLITANTVVTAAHCVANQSAADLHFLIGVDALTPDFSVPVVGIAVHPEFNAQTLANDVAVLTLSINAPVPPVSVISSIDATWTGTELLQFGYNTTAGGGRGGFGNEADAALPLLSVAPQTVAYSSAVSGTCYGDFANPTFFQDGAGHMLLVSIASSVSAANCATATTTATRLDAYLSYLGVVGSAPAAPASPNASTGCGGVTSLGYCSGDEVVWCGDNQIQRSNCSALGGHCGWSYTDKLYGCGLGPVHSADTCQGESFQGRCVGNTTVWCNSDHDVEVDNCGQSNRVCGWNVQLGYFDCLPPGLND